MRFSKRRHSTMPDLNMTPMIDVVFQLLIFFMTIPQVAALIQEPLELPKLKGTEDQQQLTLTINVTQTGDLRMGGQRTTIAGLVSFVSGELASVGGDASRLTVVVRADERGDSRAVNEVVAALSKLGIRMIRIAVQVAS